MNFIHKRPLRAGCSAFAFQVAVLIFTPFSAQAVLPGAEESDEKMAHRLQEEEVFQESIALEKERLARIKEKLAAEEAEFEEAEKTVEAAEFAEAEKIVEAAEFAEAEKVAKEAEATEKMLRELELKEKAESPQRAVPVVEEEDVPSGAYNAASQEIWKKFGDRDLSSFLNNPDELVEAMAQLPVNILFTAQELKKKPPTGLTEGEKYARALAITRQLLSLD